MSESATRAQDPLYVLLAQNLPSCKLGRVCCNVQLHAALQNQTKYTFSSGYCKTEYLLWVIRGVEVHV